MTEVQLTADELERIRIIVERNKKGLPTVEKKTKKPEKKLSYYERHKEERKEYQRNYGRIKFGYKPRAEKPKMTEEEKKEYRKKYYAENKDKIIEYQRKYREKNRDYYTEYSHKQYLRRKENGYYDKLRQITKRAEYDPSGV